MSLIVFFPEKVRDVMEREGVVDVVMMALHTHPTCAAVQVYGCRLLENMAAEGMLGKSCARSCRYPGMEYSFGNSIGVVCSQINALDGACEMLNIIVSNNEQSLSKRAVYRDGLFRCTQWWGFTAGHTGQEAWSLTLLSIRLYAPLENVVPFSQLTFLFHLFMATLAIERHADDGDVLIAAMRLLLRILHTGKTKGDAGCIRIGEESLSNLMHCICKTIIIERKSIYIYMTCDFAFFLIARYTSKNTYRHTDILACTLKSFYFDLI